MLYVINALGLSTAGGSRWGVWFLQYLSLAAALWACYRNILRWSHLHTAVLITLSVTLTLPLVFENGNLPESYALPFQFVGLLIGLYPSYARRTAFWTGICLGVSLGITFFLRQNLIGVWITLMIVGGLEAAAQRTWQLYRIRLIGLILGFALIAVPILLFLALHGVLAAFLDAAIYYNSLYTRDISVNSRIESVVEGIRDLAPSGLVFAALAGWFLGWIRFVSAFRHSRSISSIVLVVLIGLPVEMILSSLSVRSYPHYFMSWLPIIAVSAALLIERITRKRLVVVALLYAVFIQFAFVITPIARKAVEADTNKTDPVVDFITANTAPDDPVLMWGAETAYNFASGKRSPTRFVYQYPLYASGYQRDALVTEFLNDLRMRCPALIIDTSATNPIIPPLSARLRETWVPAPGYELLPSMNAVFEHIDDHYVDAGMVGDWGWRAYERQNRECMGTATSQSVPRD